VLQPTVVEGKYRVSAISVMSERVGGGRSRAALWRGSQAALTASIGRLSRTRVAMTTLCDVTHCSSFNKEKSRFFFFFSYSDFCVEFCVTFEEIRTDNFVN
jgi:hypothetical protein